VTSRPLHVGHPSLVTGNGPLRARALDGSFGCLLGTLPPTGGNRLAPEGHLGHSRWQHDPLAGAAVHRLHETPYTRLGQLHSHVLGPATDDHTCSLRAGVDSAADELGSVYGPLVIVAAYTGLRPSEWAALEWRDVDRAAAVLTVDRAFSYGRLKPPKTKGSRRRVPLPARALAALETIPRRIDSRLVFYGPRGAHIDLRNWRKREWQPACESAGLWTRPAKGQTGPPCPRPYQLRHSYARWMLAAGVPAYDVARYMGSSLRMVDAHYGHLVKGSESVHGSGSMHSRRNRARLPTRGRNREDRLAR
jgi:Phage integrase family